MFLYPVLGSGGDGRVYANKVTNALNFVSHDGTFIFTSSGGVFTENSGGLVDENSNVVLLEEIGVELFSPIWVVRAKILLLQRVLESRPQEFS